jgi:anti-sigma factor RsiW
MSACADREMLIHGLLDGELDAVNTLACETHLMSCSACNDQFVRLRALRAAIAAPGVAQPAPAGLRTRIEAAVEAPSPRPIPPPRRIASWAAPGALGAVGASLAAGLALIVAVPQMADDGVDRQLVASHVRSLLANHLTDVATSNQHVVRPWFNGKADVAPPAPELADEGFPLVGGRLDYIEGRVVPAIVYRRRLHTVNLFVWPADGKGAAWQRTARRDGYSLVEWSQGGLRLSAVSDIDMSELKQFRQAFSERSPK